jgi:hypothetical protein
MSANILKERTLIAMKFRVNSPEHSEQIQKKLFEMGYKWAGNASLQHTDKPAIFAGFWGKKEMTYASDFHGFEDEGKYNCQEYILTPQNTFVKRSEYYKQPETPCKCVVCEDQLQNAELYADHDSDVENEALIEKKKGSWKDIVFGPELTSKEEHQRLRKMDILRAMLKKLEQKENVPDEWHEELNQLMWERQNSLQFIKEKN